MSDTPKCPRCGHDALGYNLYPGMAAPSAEEANKCELSMTLECARRIITARDAEIATLKARLEESESERQSLQAEVDGAEVYWGRNP